MKLTKTKRLLAAAWLVKLSAMSEHFADDIKHLTAIAGKYAKLTAEQLQAAIVGHIRALKNLRQWLSCRLTARAYTIIVVSGVRVAIQQ